MMIADCFELIVLSEICSTRQNRLRTVRSVLSVLAIG